MEFESKLNKQGLFYIRDDIRKIIGDEITILSYTNCVILKNKNTDYKTLIKNLKLVMNDLKLKIENDRNNGDKNHEFNS